MTTIYTLDPLQDSRWLELLQKHPEASVFHTPSWLQALRRTYGYQPIVFTTASPKEQLKDGIVFCRVKDWLRGSRLVSVPFSDHCQPLVSDEGNLALLLDAVRRNQGCEKWKYIELRPLPSWECDHDSQAAFVASKEFFFHRLDLRPDVDALFGNFHKSCVRRKIYRAERENLEYESGRSEALLSQFYCLLVLTRRRQRLPPQPITWFRNLIDYLGSRLTIRVVSKDRQPVASIVTLSFKHSLVYKYGCSDARHHRLGGMQLLLWRAIQEGKSAGALEFDLGRSDAHNSGLVAFKDHWGAPKSHLVYFRFPPNRSSARRDHDRQWASHLFRWMPDRVLTVAGKLLYRHIG